MAKGDGILPEAIYKEGQKIWVGLEKPRFKSQVYLLVGVGFGTND